MMSPAQRQLALRAAREAARKAAQVLEYYWHRGVEAELKTDATPVTIADREAEQVITRVLREALPQAAVYGEESGLEGTGDGLLWLVDPLDGTKGFVRHTPFFSTQIALMDQGELVLGVSSAPVYGEVMWACAGGGAWFGNQPVHVAATSDVAQASISIGNVRTLAGDASRWAALGRLAGESNRIRGYGDFCHYHLLARGSLDLVLESDVNILDVAALAVIVREAGGVFTDLEGKELTLHTGSVLAATPELHAKVLPRWQAMRSG